MPRYEPCGKDVRAVLDDALSAHPDLVDAGVTITLTAAYRKEGSEGPTLKHHGYPALAIAKIHSTKDRVEGKDDCSITIDGDRYADLSDEERVALLDHEANHFLLVRDESGNVELDDCSRPKMKTRPHDMELGVFFEVIDRHKINAIEAQAYRDLHREMSQREFPWG